MGIGVLVGWGGVEEFWDFGGFGSDLFSDVCIVWGFVIYFVICFDSSSFFIFILVFVIMVKIKEGLGGIEKGSRKRKRERKRREREKLVSKVEIVYVGNIEIILLELIKNV